MRADAAPASASGRPKDSMRIPLSLSVLFSLLCGCGITVPDEGAVAEPFWIDGHGGGDASNGDGFMADSLAGDATEVAGGSGPSSHYYAFWNQARVLQHNPTPFGDAWQPSRTTTIGLMRIDWLGTHGQAWLVPCALHASEFAGSTINYPAPFVDALAEGPFTVERSGEGISLPEKTQWVGLQKGYAGDMPAVGQGDFAALSDDDADGHPGVTLFIHMPVFSDQAMYVVERVATQWTAQPQSDGMLHALPQTDARRVVVGATQSLLVTPQDEKPLSGEDPEELILALTTAETSCAALLAAPQQFTGQTWPP